MTKENQARLLEEGREAAQTSSENKDSNKCTKPLCLQGVFIFAGLVTAGGIIGYVNSRMTPPCPITYPRCFSYTADNFKMTAEFGEIITLPKTLEEHCANGTYPAEWADASLNMLVAPNPATHEMLVIGPIIGYPEPADARQRAAAYIDLNYLWPIGQPLLDPFLDYVCVSRKGGFAEGPACENPAAFALGSKPRAEVSDNESMPELVDDPQFKLPNISSNPHRIFNRLIKNNGPVQLVDAVDTLETSFRNKPGF